MLPIVNSLVRRVKRFRAGYGPIQLTGPYGLIVLGVAAFIGSFIFAAVLKWAGLAFVGLGVLTLFWPGEKQSRTQPKSTA